MSIFMNSLIDLSVTKSVRNGVCAIGYYMVPFDQHRRDLTKPDFHIVGTGFLIAPNIIITCRHVINSLHQAEDVQEVPKDQFYVSFVYPRVEEPLGWQAHLSTIDLSLFPDGENDPDLGFIRIDPNTVTEDFKQCQPLSFGNLDDVHLGDHVAVFGYPEGNKMHQPNMSHDPQGFLVRVGPLLQQGFISGASPFEVEGGYEYLIDVRTEGGTSGGPVFNPRTGQVLGVHYMGNKLTTSKAIALREVDIQHWLTVLAEPLASQNPNKIIGAT